LIITLGVFGILFGTYNIVCVYGVKPTPINESVRKEDEDAELVPKNIELSKKQIEKMTHISELISNGANVFLLYEYLCLFVFVLLLSALIALTAEHKLGNFYTTIAFATGSLTSILCGYIGMRIATAANYRTAYKAQ
jgi:Na+/H+-translocating membrane pyrophosphatase